MLTIEVQSAWELPPEIGDEEKKWRLPRSRDSIEALRDSRAGDEKPRVHLMRNNNRDPTQSRSIVSANTITFAMKNQYKMSRALFFDKAESDPADSSSGFTYSRLKISIHVRRKSGYYLTNVIFPAFMITSSVLASFGLDSTIEDGSRLEMCAGVLVALTTFKYLLKLVAYNTLFDWYVLSCFMFVMGIIYLQLFTGLGVYDEVGGMYSVAVSPPAAWPWWPGYDEADAEAMTRTFQVPAPLLWGFAIWWGYHCLIVLLFWSFHVRRSCWPPESRVVCNGRFGKDGIDALGRGYSSRDVYRSRSVFMTEHAGSEPGASRARDQALGAHSTVWTG